ncbi:MAG: trypsin-like peptidase domain-containing protein [Patescibacteria group bacterium]|jgi:S1-C subfamily serine protease
MKKYLFLFLFSIGILFSATSANAETCSFKIGSINTWNSGKITSFDINSMSCQSGFGTDGQVKVSVNDIPTETIYGGMLGISVKVPSSVEGLVTVTVVGQNGNLNTYNGTYPSGSRCDQLLVSLKVDSHPSSITLGGPIEITGNFANTPGSEDINSNWPGKVANLSTSGFGSWLPLISWTDTKIVISTINSNYFKIGVNSLKVFYASSNINDGYQSKSFDVNILAPVCTISSWICGDWSGCAQNGLQTRLCNKEHLNTRSDDGGIGGNSNDYCEGGVLPVTSQSCTYIPSCTSDDWSCVNWSTCSSGGKQTRSCSKTSNCQGGVSSPEISQSCVYTPTCISLYYSSWSECASDGKQTRSITSKYPTNCEGGESPKLTQSCSYTPACSVDTWECGNWGNCSPQGTQSRSCNRTYDCPSAETAAPATSQYCEAPNQPKQQSPTEDLGIVNQDTIIKSTVKLICPVSSTMASQGSGTVIDSKGTILTNKHVIDGTPGCLVGFIDSYGDEPYFGDRQIADIYKVSSNSDVAVLKLRNPSNINLASVNISQSNSSSIKLGETLTTYGYPAKFGTKITYTSGDFSGVDSDYLKTTAIIEHGNSGGGAYLKNGAFIGIPTAVIKGSLNSMGYLLSVNTVNGWLNNSVAYNNNSNNNNYSRVSAILDNIDLNALGSLGLFVAGDEANIKTATESQTVIAEEKKLTTKIDNNLSKRMNGNILLQVEKNGEGWYVYPDDKKKYYLGRPADAFSIMRNLGLGIKHSELAKYLNSKFSIKLSGKILLDVEKNGEAYYVNPKDLKGYFLNRPADAFKVMRELGLGITNADIRKIGVGEIK